jgi:ABC-type uncharacterized transport system YnjBCD permease subunit
MCWKFEITFCSHWRNNYQPYTKIQKPNTNFSLSNSLSAKIGGELKTTILEIYALAVCFVTVVCFAIALGIGMYDVVQISIPQITTNGSIGQEISDATKSVIQVVIVLVIDVSIFIPHWFIAKKARLSRS